MNFADLKEWLVPLSSAFGILSVAVGVRVALRELGFKARADARLAESARVEADIKLVKAFNELMEVAHARGPSVLVSEKLFEALAKHFPLATPAQAKDLAVVTLPVGIASQDAAIAGVAALGQRHEILKPMALQALRTLATFKPSIAAALLQRLERE